MLGLVAFLVPSLCVTLLGAWLVVTGWRGRRLVGDGPEVAAVVRAYLE